MKPPIQPDRSGDPLPDMLEAIPLPCLLVGGDERIFAANAEALTLLGQRAVGRHFAAILRQPQIIEAIENALSGVPVGTRRYLANDGAQDTTFEVTCRPVAGPEPGRGAAVLVCLKDITQLEQAGQMRRDFVANVSHELRTPLTAIMGFIETLRGPARADDAARERFLGIMEEEAGRMNRLVGDLISLNRVETEERVRPRDRVELVGQIAATLNSIRPLAADAGVELIFDHPDPPVEVTGDADQLRQVMVNLIANAIKYGGSGGEVCVALTESARDPAVRGPAARIQVIDKGPGIDPLHLPRLTERFYRADSHRSRQLGGTGLGLAIVKHVVNRHRGRLRVESDLGKGAVFTVILPK